jgi:hypothetical protein
VRWLTLFPDRAPYGRPDPTINLEALPKPTSRVLIPMQRAKDVLENPRAYATDRLLSGLLEQMKHEEKSFRTVLPPYFDRSKSGVLIRCGLHIARRAMAEEKSFCTVPPPLFHRCESRGFTAVRFSPNTQLMRGNES